MKEEVRNSKNKPKRNLSKETEPLEEAIREQLEAGLSPFASYFRNQKPRKNKYSTLPKRFSDRLERLPKHVFLNVNECMIFLYREGQSWVLEQAFEYLNKKMGTYPYEEKVTNLEVTLEEIRNSYWLSDMRYLDQKTIGMNYTIQMDFQTDLTNETGDRIYLITKIMCQVDADGHTTFHLFHVDLMHPPTQPI